MYLDFNGGENGFVGKAMQIGYRRIGALIPLLKEIYFVSQFPNLHNRDNDVFLYSRELWAQMLQ